MSPALRDSLQSLLGSAFRLDRELGGGGMSRVFVAHEPALKRDVVVKVLPSDLFSRRSAERFQREIEVTARLQHPHILPVVTAGGSERLRYYRVRVGPYESRDRAARVAERVAELGYSAVIMEEAPVGSTALR